MKDEEIRKAVRESYEKIATQDSRCCGPASSCGCGCGSAQDTVSIAIGYNDEDLSAVPEGANLGLGCGNPVALASLQEGETVLDLGSGAGFDCFLAANKVGEMGRVIGVDMTPEMVARARENALKGDYNNVEFRLGEIENLPVADASIDVVISNCVINLSSNKKQVFKDVFRVLKPGGRLMVSDIVLLKPLPEPIRNSVEAYVGCVAGASLKNDYLANIQAAGFRGAQVLGETVVPVESIISAPVGQAVRESTGTTPEVVEEVANSVISIKVSAIKSG